MFRVRWMRDLYFFISILIAVVVIAFFIFHSVSSSVFKNRSHAIPNNNMNEKKNNTRSELYLNSFTHWNKARVMLFIYSAK